MLAVLIYGALLVVLAGAHPHYRDDIPNGYFVPDPCKLGHIWEAVGHVHPHSGMHGWNPFGEEWKLKPLPRVWDVEFCQKDSDGDGRTNGEELGDPDCNWVKGSIPIAGASGHPGLCDNPSIDHPDCSHHSHWCHEQPPHTFHKN